MKIVFVFLALVTIVFTVNSQGIVDGSPNASSKCDLRLDKAPAIREGIITCTDFTLSLTTDRMMQGRLQLHDTAGDRKRTEERARIEEAERNALKP